MIESWMFFTLGMLVAGLIAILIVPAINARAERLARRRVEGMLPLSMTELNAEKDHLRAELAVEQRRIERRAEEAMANRHKDMEELGRRALRLDAQAEELAAKDAAVQRLEAELAAARQELAGTQADRTAKATALGTAESTVGALQSARDGMRSELDALRAAATATATELATLRTALKRFEDGEGRTPPPAASAAAADLAENAELRRRIDAVADQILEAHERERATPTSPA